jgi:hypothetical protein
MFSFFASEVNSQGANMACHKTALAAVSTIEPRGFEKF